MIINDPVHGFIEIPKGLLTTLVKHPAFVRLSRIEQLGPTSYVYPGGCHSRFSHSIGTLHLITEALRILERKGCIITPEEAKTHPRRNWVTRAIGTEPHVKVDLFSEEWEAGDILILCSDGLFCSLNDADFCRILASCADLDDACETLSALAYENGSSDNITVVLIQNAEDAQ